MKKHVHLHILIFMLIFCCRCLLAETTNSNSLTGSVSNRGDEERVEGLDDWIDEEEAMEDIGILSIHSNILLIIHVYLIEYITLSCFIEGDTCTYDEYDTNVDEKTPIQKEIENIAWDYYYYYNEDLMMWYDENSANIHDTPKYDNEYSHASESKGNYDMKHMSPYLEFLFDEESSPIWNQNDKDARKRNLRHL